MNESGFAVVVMNSGGFGKVWNMIDGASVSMGKLRGPCTR